MPIPNKTQQTSESSDRSTSSMSDNNAHAGDLVVNDVPKPLAEYVPEQLKSKLTHEKVEGEASATSGNKA
jgi:hypothetical protein